MAEFDWGMDGVAVAGRRRWRSGVSRKVCSDFSAILTASIVAVSAWLASLLLGEYSEPVKYLSVGVLGGIFTAELYSHKGYHDFDRLLSVWSTMKGLIWRWAIVLLVLTALAFLADVSEDFSRRWMVYWAVIGGTGIVVSRFVTAHFLMRMSRVGGSLSRRVAVVGATDMAAKFISLLNTNDNAVQIVGIYDDRAPFREHSAEVPLTGSLDDLFNLGMRGSIDDIVIALPWSAENRIDEVFHRLAVLPANTVVCPDMLWLTNMHGGISHLGGVPLLNIHRRPLEGWGGILKEIEDRVISALLLTALSPLMLFIAILVKLDSRGPVFFSQNRHGFQHDVFKIHKFRTMTVMENGSEVKQATKDDARVTSVGKFLRRYSLDELPQLWNVLMGDMSLVGPRPHAIAHNEQYARVIADYAGRHKVKPGISGWAQVNGCRGETSEDQMMEERVRYDLYYIENWSLFFDIRIIIMTVWAVIFPKNAY